MRYKGLIFFLLCFLLITCLPILSQDWPFEHANKERTGYFGGPVPVPPLAKSWEFKAGGAFTSSPALYGDMLYIGSWDKHVYALDAKTGKLNWKFKAEDVIYSSPVVVDGVVYVGSWDKNVYALDGRNGKLLWSFTAESKIYASPAVSGSRIYVASETRLYAIERLSPNPSSPWTFWDDVSFYSSPVIYRSILYIGSGGNKIYAIDTVNGKKIWEAPVKGWVNSSPAIYGNRLFIGCQDRKLYAFNLLNGSLVWEFTCGNVINSSPVASETAVYIGSNDGYLYSVDTATGKKNWTFQTDSPILATPVLTGQHMYVVSSEGNFSVLENKEGKPLWQYDLKQQVSASPVAGYGGVYVATKEGYLYAFASEKEVKPTTSLPKAKSYDLIYARVTSLSLGDPFNMVISRGSGDGVFKGSKVIIKPNRGNGLEDSIIAKGVVEEISYNTAVVNFKSNEYPQPLIRRGDTAIIEVQTSPARPSSILYQLAKLDVIFLALENVQPFYTYAESLQPEFDEGKTIKAMTDEINKQSNYAFILTGNEIIRTGKFKGMRLHQAFSKTLPEDMKNFLKHILVSKQQNSYVGNDWKLVEVYGGWIMKGMPDK